MTKTIVVVIAYSFFLNMRKVIISKYGNNKPMIARITLVP